MKDNIVFKVLNIIISLGLIAGSIMVALYFLTYPTEEQIQNVVEADEPTADVYVPDPEPACEPHPVIAINVSSVCGTDMACLAKVAEMETLPTLEVPIDKAQLQPALQIFLSVLREVAALACVDGQLISVEINGHPVVVLK